MMSRNDNSLLQWLGTSRGCEGLPVNGNSLLAGTQLAVGVRREGSYQEDPGYIYVYKKYGTVWGHLLDRLTGHRGILVQKLKTYPCSDDRYAYITEPWPLTVPPPSGLIEIFCSLDPAGLTEGPSVQSVGYSGYAQETADIAPSVGAGVGISGVNTNLEVGSSGYEVVNLYVVAAIDPRVSLELLLPGEELAGHVASRLSDIHDQLDEATARVSNVWGTFDHEVDGKSQLDPWRSDQWHLEVVPRELRLDNPGQSQDIALKVTAGERRGPFFAAVSIRDMDTGGTTVSNLISIY